MKVLIRQRLLWTIFAAAVICWAMGLFSVTPFDYDESFYRRSAEEMNISKNFIVPTLDFDLQSSKPPFFAWILLASSRAADGAGAIRIGTFAARLPSFLFTLGTLWMICAAYVKRMQQQGRKIATPLLPALLWTAALLPALGSVAVLTDPALTFFLTPVLLGFATLAKNDGPICFEAPGVRTSIVMGFGMGLATMIKGPIGIALPGFAVFLYILFMAFRMRWSAKKIAGEYIATFVSLVPALVVAVVVSGAYYLFLYFSGGEELLKEFFITHNLQRATRGIEGHGGSFFYHFIVLLIAGIPFVPVFLYHLFTDRAFRLRLWGFPAVWAMGCLLFFSLISTKLPNYTWPLWPGLALAFALAINSVENNSSVESQKRWLARLLALPSFLLATSFLFLGVFTVPLQIISDRRAVAFLENMGPLPPGLRMGLLMISACCLVITYIVASQKAGTLTLHTVLRMSLISTVTVLCINLLVAPGVSEIMTSPWQRISEKALGFGAPELGVVGFSSPNASSAWGRHIHYLNAEEVEAFTAKTGGFLVVGRWNTALCDLTRLEVLATDRYLTLCGKNRR